MLDPFHEFGDGARKLAELEKRVLGDKNKMPKNPGSDTERAPSCFGHEEELGDPSDGSRPIKQPRNPLALPPKTVL